MKHIMKLFRVKNNVVKDRIQILDYIRGLAVLLILLHHSGIPCGDWILAFHMPLLFFLSGYTDFLRNKKWTFRDYFENRFIRLIVPYFLFEFVNLLLWQVYMIRYGGWQDLTEALKGILSVVNTDTYMGFYGRLWFLPCMFVSDLLFWVIKRTRTKGNLWLCAGAMLVLSWVSSEKIPYRLLFTTDTALMATAFLIMGYALGEWIQWLLMKQHVMVDVLCGLAAVGVLVVSVSTGESWCYMYTNQYGNYFLTVSAALAGSLGFLILAKWMYAWHGKIGIGKDLIMWYSTNSLATFPVHLMIKIVFLFYFSDYSTWYVLFVVMLLLNIPVVNAITMYFPFMLGKVQRKTCRAE